jgi:gluconokinase
MTEALHVVVMGVAGCGKSAVGGALAQRLGLPLIEGDDFHPESNIRKMREGVPLDDSDRADWLRTLAAELRAQPHGAVLTCSALKRHYRQTLRTAVPELRFVHLALDIEAALQRVGSRADHFYPPALVASQFEALEDPAGEPGVLPVDATAPLDEVVATAGDWLAGAPGAASAP